MTTFVDGPAKGHILSLRRAPLFLRVTESGGKFDALDQVSDEPRPDEKIYAYTLTERPGVMHLLVRGKDAASRGGFWPSANYRYCHVQPTDAELRDPAAWKAWCHSQPIPEFYSL